MRDVRNLADLVTRAATRGDRPALRWHDRVVTWGELDAQVSAVAAALARRGPALAGDTPPRVAIALPNIPEFAAAFFGVLRAGFVAVPVNPEFTRRELSHVLADSGATVLIATPAVHEALGGAGTTVEAVYTVGTGVPAGTRPFADLLTPGAPGTSPPPAGTGSDLAALMYTSGTVGAPRAAMLTHRALLANHEQLARIDPPPVGPDDVVLLSVPMFHTYGLNTGLGGVAYHGACGVLTERFDPVGALDLIDRHRVTVILGVPPMYVAWSLVPDQAAEAFATVRVAVSGAAPLDQATAGRFRAATGVRIHEGYGLTETAPVLISTLTGTTGKPGSIGRPVPGVEVKLVDAAGVEIELEEDDLDDDPVGGSPGTDPGQIVARGPNLFDGYWPDGHGGPDADGWWATGDVAYADADGDFFLVDRLGELILVSGFNVYPNEVEHVLTMHPAVVEAAAVAAPHPYTGQTVKVYVVVDEGVTVTEEELLGHCERNLARFKCPTVVEFVAELPRSSTGKVRKSALGSRQ